MHFFFLFISFPRDNSSFSGFFFYIKNATPENELSRRNEINECTCHLSATVHKRQRCDISVKRYKHLKITCMQTY